MNFAQNFHTCQGALGLAVLAQAGVTVDAIVQLTEPRAAVTSPPERFHPSRRGREAVPRIRR
jgi:hypothetical protein